MDGTIANLYGIKDWLPRLRNNDPTIFLECDPIIKILSMTPKDASKEYCKNVAEQKNFWLNTYFPRLTKRIYRAYGHNKNLKNSWKAILIDDSAPIRKSWNGKALDPATLWD